MTRRAGWITVLTVGTLCGCAESEQLPQHTVPGGDAERGRLLVSAYGCGSCHIIPGISGADGVVGPPLTDWAGRQWIAGNLWNEPGNLIAWLHDPQAIEPGTAMPSQGVTEEEAAHMAAYLYTLDAPTLGPPHPFPLRWLESIGHVRRTGPND
jgi:cytochrome c2